MEEISKILETDKTLRLLENILKTKENCTIYLSGPEGVGKSWLTLTLNDFAKNIDYCILFLNGKENKKEESYYPLKLFVEKKHKSFNKTVNALKETIGGIPYVGKSIKSLISDYDFRKHKLKNTIQDIYPFKNHLDFSLHLVGLQRKYEKIIIICDDIATFDSDTINYLSELQKGFVQLEIEFRVIFVLVSINPELYANYFGYGRQYHIKLSALTQNQTKLILKKWSGKTINDEQISLIHSCSGGHLQLLKIIGNYIKETNENGIFGNKSDFLKTIIDSRLKLKEQYEKIKKVLVAISQSGENATTFEILCLLGDEEHVRELIEYAISLDLLFVKDNYIHFSHPVVRDYITSVNNNPNNSFFLKFSACLRKLAPANYIRRAEIESLIQYTDSVNIYWALAAIQKMRVGSIGEIERLKKQIKISLSYGSDLKIALEQFEKCYELSFKGLIEETLLAVEQISNSLPKQILCEKYYLKCENLAKMISISPKEEVLRIISQWEDIKEDEPEIWYRFAQLKIISASELGLIDTALRTETEIVKYFSARLIYDSHAKTIIERLNIFSEVIYTPEVAHIKMIQTEKWLTKELINEEFHKVIDLYISRTNLSSNCILVDELEQSINYALSAISLTKEFKQVKFPSLEACISNLQLALVLYDMNNLQTVTEKYKELYNSVEVEENKILIDVNYAGLLLLNNKIDEAYGILQNSSYIPDYEKDDFYYIYYYWCNYSIILFLLGNYEEAQKQIKQLEKIVNGNSHFLANYYKKHYSLIFEIICSTKIKTYSDLKSFMENRMPIFSSKIWKKFKMVYLFTDIQIWLTS